MRILARHCILLLGIGLIATNCTRDTAPQEAAEPSEPKKVKIDFAKKAEALAKKFTIVDGHIDIPYRLEASKDAEGKLTEDISQRTTKGDFDYPRSVQGGLDAPFMSIYVPAKYQKAGGAKKVADGLIDMVEGFVTSWPDKFALAKSTADILANKKANKISLPLGIENGAAIEDDLKNVEHFYKRGVRYITLTHSKDNQICDSSYDDRHSHKGLTPFGAKVVKEMNRLGIMVDISHVSDDAFNQVMALTKVPAIASHSSARHFTPGFERNMSDAMIKKLAENGGVIMINFGSTFISQESRDHFDKRKKDKASIKKSAKMPDDSPKLKEILATYDKQTPRIYATVENVADHIDHVVKLVGIDHVGFGSDYDGVGDSLPTGLKDASTYPNLIRVLLERGYSDGDIEKICSGNILRVWKAVEEHAAQSRPLVKAP